MKDADLNSGAALAGFEDVSGAGRCGLLGLSLARLRYGSRAATVVMLPFAAWYFFLGHHMGAWVALEAWLVLGSVVLTHALAIFRREQQQDDPERVLRRWLPWARAAALVYGGTLVVPMLVSARHVPFEFSLLYLVSLAAIVAGHSVHSSPVVSVFRPFLVASWGCATLVVPWVFADHWYFILPLNLVFARTMTKHAETSHQFYVQNLALQERAARLAADYQAARQEAVDALQDRNRFLSTASHDLRQPVHAISFLVESILARNRDPDLVAGLDDLRRSAAALRLMFDALLDLSRLEDAAGAARPVAVPLDPLLQEVAAMFGHDAQRRGLQLRVRRCGAAVVHADPLLLRQSLVNLTQNALRYTLRGGVLIAARRRGAGWRIEVWDTGMGIKPDERTQIFSPFYRSERAWKHDNAGHGLGLAVVARCARLMAAPLGVESRQGHGSWFWLRLPAAES